MTESDFAVLTWAVPKNLTPPMSITHFPLHGHTDLVTTSCFHPHDSNNIIQGNRDGSIKIWSISDCLSNNTFLSAVFRTNFSSQPTIRSPCDFGSGLRRIQTNHFTIFPNPSATTQPGFGTHRQSARHRRFVFPTISNIHQWTLWTTSQE